MSEDREESIEGGIPGSGETSDTESSDSPRTPPRTPRNKFDRLLGEKEVITKFELNTESYDARYDNPNATPQSIQPKEETSSKGLGKLVDRFRSKEETSSKGLGKLVGTILFQDREKVNEDDYSNSLRALDRKVKKDVSQTQDNEAKEEDTKILTKLHLVTEDGHHLEGLRISAKDPNAGTIVVFQGKDGNFKSHEQLDRLATLAKETGQNVVAFNYRQQPGSINAVFKDASAVCGYLTNNKRVDAGKITLAGESFGGAIASEMVSRLQEQNKNVCCAIAVNSPKSLSEAVATMDLTELKQTKTFKMLSKFQQPIATVLEKIFKISQWELKAQDAVNASEKIMTVSTEGDKVVSSKAALKSPLNHVDCTTNEPDKHNARWQGLIDNDRKTVIDHIKELPSRLAAAPVKAK